MLARVMYKNQEDYENTGYEDELENERYFRPYKLRKLCMPEHGVHEIWTNHPDILRSMRNSISNLGVDAVIKVIGSKIDGVRTIKTQVYDKGELITEDCHDYC